jgi:hypothetical protein
MSLPRALRTLNPIVGGVCAGNVEIVRAIEPMLRNADGRG